MTVTSVRADSTCIDAAAATAAAERLISSEGVAAIMGADCSGVTTAIINNATVPQGIVNISPSATSPALSSIEDNGLFFRTAPSDARQGIVLAEVVMDRGIDEVAVTFTNNDYGQGFADAFVAAYEGMGGTVTLSAPHEDGRGDYSAEVGALAAAGGDALVVLGYVDQGGLGVIRSAIDTGAFDTFVGGDGMFGDSLLENLGDDLETWFGTVPGAAIEGERTHSRPLLKNNERRTVRSCGQLRRCRPHPAGHAGRWRSNLCCCCCQHDGCRQRAGRRPSLPVNWPAVWSSSPLAATSTMSARPVSSSSSRASPHGAFREFEAAWRFARNRAHALSRRSLPFQQASAMAAPHWGRP
jgi:hypothetical protein